MHACVLSMHFTELLALPLQLRMQAPHQDNMFACPELIWEQDMFPITWVQHAACVCPAAFYGIFSVMMLCVYVQLTSKA